MSANKYPKKSVLWDSQGTQREFWGKKFNVMCEPLINSIYQEELHNEHPSTG